MSRKPDVGLGTEHRDSGLSLVELIVAMAVSVILLLGIGAVFTQGLKTQQEQAARNLATQELNTITIYLNESMRGSVGAYVSESNTRIDMSFMKVYGAATIECRSWKIYDGKLFFSSGPGPRRGFNPDAWTVLAKNVADPVVGGNPAGFVEEDGTFRYNLAIFEGDIEVAVEDGGYPRGKAKYYKPECWELP